MEAVMDRSDARTLELELSYRQHGAALLLFALAMTGERSRAQDAVHQVFLKLLESGDLERARDPKAYLFGCVRNAVLDERKRQDRNQPLDDSAWFSPPDRDYAAEQNLHNALVVLPVDQREAVVLHIWGELTFAQIADLLEVSSNTVASRYRYALNKLRELMSRKENFCAGSR
jgi:RNA polymerase sigma-70 factor, ECF subfamily